MLKNNKLLINLNQFFQFHFPWQGIFSQGNHHKHLKGTSYNDEIIGTIYNDEIIGKAGDDVLNGNSGNDEIYGDGGNDVLNGNSGNDEIYGDGGNDILIYKLSENLNHNYDYYDGGSGKDKLSLILTNSEYLAYQEQINQYQTLLARSKNPFHHGVKYTFNFGGSILKVKNIETLEIIKSNVTPTAINDTIITDEESSISFNPSLNDIDPDHLDQLKTTAINTTNTIGLVTLNNGIITYDPDDQFAYLGQGETATDTFSYTVADLANATDTATVTVTINGVNDRPIASNILLNINEDSSPVTDQFLVVDLDSNDSHTFTILNQPSVGILTNNNNGSFTFNFGNDFQDLAEGETTEVTFQYNAIDDSGANNAISEAKTVTIKIEGQNDLPLILTPENTNNGITKLDNYATITEITDGNPQENNTLFSQSGTIYFFDPDRNDNHLISVIPQETDYLGLFQAIIPENVSGNMISWSFNVQDQVLDDLAQGQTISQVYTIKIDDQHGGIITQDVTIDLVGTNDAPIVSNINLNAQENDISVNGNFNISDVDLADDHTINIINQPLLGELENHQDGTFTFSLKNDFQDLREGETRQVNFSYTATDNSGAENATSEAKNVTINVTGVNDSALITGTSTGMIIEDQTSLSVYGKLNITDPDNGQNLFQTITNQQVGYGLFSIAENGLWNYQFTREDLFQTLNNNQYRYERFNVTSVDGTSKQINIDIKGQDEILFSPFSDYNGTVIEDVNNVDSGNITGLAWFTNVFVVPNSNPIGNFSAWANVPLNINWSFNVNNSTIDYLAKDEKITQQYKILGTSTDIWGTNVTDQVIVTVDIIGTNDQPIMITEDNTGSVTEKAPYTDILNNLLTDSGLINFTDVDLKDTHTISSILPQGENYLGLFTANINQDSTQGNTGQINWNFQVEDGQLNYLKQDESLTQIYTITLDDGKGGIDTQDVTITLNGADDPTITLNENLNFISEDQSMWATGDATVIDWKTFWGFDLDPITLNTTIFGGLNIPDIVIPGTPEINLWGWIIPGIPQTVISTPDIPQIVLDGNVSIKAGLEPYIKFTSGDIDTDLGIDLTLEIPQNIEAGQTITIASGYLLKDDSFFNTFSPNLTVGLNFLIDVKGNAKIEAVSLDGTSRTTLLDLSNIDIDKTFNLFEFNTEDNLNLDIDLGPLDFTLNFPVINTEGTVLDANTLTSQGEDNILTATLDLDELPTAIKEVLTDLKNNLSNDNNNDPPEDDDSSVITKLEDIINSIPNLSADLSWQEGEINADLKTLMIDIGKLTGEYTVLDLDLNGYVDLEQAFTLDLNNLMGKLIFENGQSQQFTVGENFNFTIPEGFDVNGNGLLDATAVIDLEATIKNQLSLGLRADLSVELLSASLDLDFAGWINGLGLQDINQAYGPLYENTFDLYEGDSLISFPSIDFNLEGFNQGIFNIGTGSGNPFDFWTQAKLWVNDSITEDERTYFNPENPVVVMTHGFSGADSLFNTPAGVENNTALKNLASAIDSYYDQPINIILWDWYNQSGNMVTEYSDIAPKVVEVGEDIAQFLVELGADPTQTTLIGHSLGAQVMGNAGDQYQQLTGETIDLLIGLDPAGPLFEDDFDLLTGLVSDNQLDEVTNRLDPSDATQVVALHTSSVLGYDPNIADLDLYLNWEDPYQPGQSSFVDNHNGVLDQLTQLFEGEYFNQGTGTDQENNTTLVGATFDINDILNTSLTGVDYVETYLV